MPLNVICFKYLGDKNIIKYYSFLSFYKLMFILHPLLQISSQLQTDFYQKIIITITKIIVITLLQEKGV